MTDTIAALSSGRPPAGISVIRTSGTDAHRLAEAIAGPLPAPRQASLRTFSHPVSGVTLDQGILLRFDAPHSATGEHIMEYQCHGGRAVVSALLDAMTSFPGVRLAEPGEFTRRALEHGRMDLTEAEGLADLLEAETESQRRAALALTGGALTRQFNFWQAELLDLSARAEAAIDYVGDEDETATDTASLRLKVESLASELDGWLARPRAERLKDGIRVVVAGPPNAGKSSLINVLAGDERAIVTPIAGTTRDSIEVPLSIAGTPFLLIDTAGLRESDDPVESIGIDRARNEAERADLILWLGSPEDAPSERDRVIIIHSKSDLYGREATALNVSAKTREGIEDLVSLLRLRAEDLLPLEGDIALNRRQAAVLSEVAELLRSPLGDLILVAEVLRSARNALDRLTGRAGIEDALDSLFGRFCLGK